MTSSDLRPVADPPIPYPGIAAIVDGGTNRQVAEQLGLSEQTVKNHLSVVYDKLGVSNRLELALYAIHHKLLDRLPPTE